MINTTLLEDEHASFLGFYVYVIFIAYDTRCPSLNPVFAQVDLDGYARFSAVWQLQLTIAMGFEEMSLSVS